MRLIVRDEQSVREEPRAAELRAEPKDRLQRTGRQLRALPARQFDTTGEHRERRGTAGSLLPLLHGEQQFQGRVGLHLFFVRLFMLQLFCNVSVNLWQFVVTRMLEACQQYVVAKRSNLTHWHPVLGWFAQTIDTSLQDATPSVKLQLTYLWTGRIVTHLIGKRIIRRYTGSAKFVRFPPLSLQSSNSSVPVFRAATDRAGRERGPATGGATKHLLRGREYLPTGISRGSHQQEQQHEELQETGQSGSHQGSPDLLSVPNGPAHAHADEDRDTYR